MLQFATPMQLLHPLEYGSLPMTHCMHGPLARHGAWSGLQVQPVATAHVCVDAVHSVQPQRGSQTPLTSAAAPCGGFISTPPASSVFAAKDSVVAETHQASKKKGNEERVYSIEQFRSMLCSVLRGAGAQGSGAEAVAAAAGFPSARSSLKRYAKDIRNNPSLQDSSAPSTLLLQLAHVSQLQFYEKGNEDMKARRIFSDDELEFFARALKLYGDMGWPMDYTAIGDMMAEAAKKAGKIDWKTGKPFVVCAAYVAKFVEDRPELAAFKASNIDPLRAKKGTAQVSVGAESERTVVSMHEGKPQPSLICKSHETARSCHVRVISKSPLLKIIDFSIIPIASERPFIVFTKKC